MTHSHMEYKRRSFDIYCKLILKYAARTFYKKMQKRGERETVFSVLSERELNGLAAGDEYFMNEYLYDVLGESISVTDYGLGKALNLLPKDKRDIVLMSYFFDMTDIEIAIRLNMARRTVANRRASCLRKLRNLMESGD
jgi:DNA-directed RNA polymerase specialized sigma24 family protein